MWNTRPVARLLILGGLLLLSGGCRQTHQGWEPPLEETSTRFLQGQVEEALQLVRGAQGRAQTDAVQVEERLDGAVRVLLRVSKYYLPLLEARERTYNAHRLLYFGERRGARAEIRVVENILDQMAENGGSELLPTMKDALDLVSEAKAAVMATSDKAPDLIASLARKLNFMALKGELELQSDWPAPESPDG